VNVKLSFVRLLAIGILFLAPTCVLGAEPTIVYPPNQSALKVDTVKFIGLAPDGFTGNLQCDAKGGDVVGSKQVLSAG
jgi:hypothetical protein